MRLGRPALVLFLAAAIPFARQLTLGFGLLEDDVFLQSLPAWEWCARALKTGESILWSPEVIGGFPIAFTQYPFLYPPNLLLLWMLPAAQAYAWSLVLHLFLAGLLTYAYCRLVGIGVKPSLIAAISFELSSEIAAGGAGFTARSAFVYPGMILGVELVLRRGLSHGLVVALVVAAGLLGGHFQHVLIALLSGGAYALFRLGCAVRSKGSRATLRMAGVLMAACILGVAGAAVRLIPTWMVTELSTRANPMPASVAKMGALSLHSLLVGNLLPLSRLQDFSWSSPDYAGPVALVLVFLGIRVVVAQPLGRFFLGLVVATILLSLGDATPLHLLARLPFLSSFTEPSRFGLSTAFALCLLAGIALEGYWIGAKGGGSPRRIGYRGVMGLTAGLAVAAYLCSGLFFQFGSGPEAEGFKVWVAEQGLDALNPLRPRMGLAVVGLLSTVLVLTLASMGNFSRGQAERMLLTIVAAVLVPLTAILNPGIDSGVLETVPRTVGLLRTTDGEYRVHSQVPGIRISNHFLAHGPGPEEGFNDDLRYRFQSEMLAPSMNLQWGVPSADGYEGLHSMHQEVLLRFLLSERMSNWLPTSDRWAHLSLRERVRVLSLLNVRYLLSAVDLTPEVPDLRLVASVVVEPGPNSRASPVVYLHENPSFMPRYYLVPRSLGYMDDMDAMHAVAVGTVNPAATVLLPGNQMESAGDRGSGYTPEGHLTQQRIDIMDARNAYLRLVASNDAPAYLVTSDSYWPGWRAFVDGREVEVLRANVSGRAVWIDEPGTHVVQFHFEPPGFGLGLAISMAAVVSWAIWLGLTFSRRKMISTV